MNGETMGIQSFKQKKLIKVGGSAALSIDAQYLRDNELSVGDGMYVRYLEDGAFIAIPQNALHKFKGVSDEEKASSAASKITPELISWTKEFLATHDESMKKLANL